MSGLFESFEFLDRGWDVRVLEAQSLRSIFLWLLPLVLVLGVGLTVITYQIFHLHRISWSIVFNLLVVAMLAFRYARLIYRRIGN